MEELEMVLLEGEEKMDKSIFEASNDLGFRLALSE